MEPYQLLPPSEVKNDQISVFASVVVLAGTDPPGHFTVPGQVIECGPVPPFVSLSANPYNLPVGRGECKCATLI